MMSHERARAYVSLWAGVAAVFSAFACARVLQRPSQQPVPLTVVEGLWREPLDLDTRDLFHGPGGTALAPQPVTYSFVARKTSGTNPGYDVRDPQARLWS